MSSLPPSVPPSARPDDAAGDVVSLYQASKRIYPRAVTGLFARWRWGLVWLTQILFYGVPWLQWNDRQAVLFELTSRRFYIFGLVLYPQDFIYLTALLIVSAYGLFLFTAVAGRLWCGFACPQTVYTEIFLWIERQFEGDRMARMKLDAAPWTLDKFWRKAGTQLSWIAVGLWTGFTFVGYFTPIHTLWAEAFTFGFGPWEWFWVLFYGFATYGNAGYMREQVCKYMCPYARFQSVMFDKDTMIISYDAERGEPRGTRGRKTDLKAANLGSCIDCGLCVQVCPTGIDIRKGLQYECIGCTACIDVCDGVMDKMQYPRGLIRYATQNGMQNGWDTKQMLQRVARPRVLIYTAILGAIVVAFMVSLLTRTTFKVDVVRDRGSLARQVEDGKVENVFRLQVMNATESPQRFRITVQDLPQAVVVEKPEVEVAATEARWMPVSLQIPPEVAQQLGAGAHAFQFKVERLEANGQPGAVLIEKSTFVVPR